ncbi:MAG: indole-3-glycerol phosphate synthase TrpC [Candidatus Wallbacteria bacterium]|nr:indole-3-glycerol phosphate synthase TrpC [Candidatus Wallbacteria bacterium]
MSILQRIIIDRSKRLAEAREILPLELLISLVELKRKEFPPSAGTGPQPPVSFLRALTVTERKRVWQTFTQPQWGGGRNRAPDCRATASKRDVEADRTPMPGLVERIDMVEQKSVICQTDRQIKVIAEVKKASPSKGMIRRIDDPADLALEYEASGASAISVLTEQDHFHGSDDDLRAVKKVVKVPVLRKDFIFDEYQVYESVLMGADAVLLIVAALSDRQLKQLLDLTGTLGLDCLVETHDRCEIEKAAAAGARIIGVNNRNLRDFKVSIDCSLELRQHIPQGVVTVSESGIETMEHMLMLQKAGFDAALVGSSLLREESPGLALKRLLGG